MTQIIVTVPGVTFDNMLFGDGWQLGEFEGWWDTTKPRVGSDPRPEWHGDFGQDNVYLEPRFITVSGVFQSRENPDLVMSARDAIAALHEAGEFDFTVSTSAFALNASTCAVNAVVLLCTTPIFASICALYASILAVYSAIRTRAVSSLSSASLLFTLALEEIPSTVAAYIRAGDSYIPDFAVSALTCESNTSTFSFSAPICSEYACTSDL